jgi:hypothetical protein
MHHPRPGPRPPEWVNNVVRWQADLQSARTFQSLKAVRHHFRLPLHAVSMGSAPIDCVDCVTWNDLGIESPLPPPGRFLFLRRLATFLRPAVLGMLPSGDLVDRYRTRRSAYRLVTLPTWPGRTAKSAEAAQLAMLRLLRLQRETHRAVRGRHREAATMLARASVETMFLGIYCLRVPDAISKLHADSLKALGDGLAYIEETDLVPERVIRECVARLGTPSDRYQSVSGMVTAIDAANGNKGAQHLPQVVRAVVQLRSPRQRWNPDASRGTQREAPAPTHSRMGPQVTGKGPLTQQWGSWQPTWPSRRASPMKGSSLTRTGTMSARSCRWQ